MHAVEDVSIDGMMAINAHVLHYGFYETMNMDLEDLIKFYNLAVEIKNAEAESYKGV